MINAYSESVKETSATSTATAATTATTASGITATAATALATATAATTTTATTAAATSDISVDDDGTTNDTRKSAPRVENINKDKKNNNANEIRPISDSEHGLKPKPMSESVVVTVAPVEQRPTGITINILCYLYTVYIEITGTFTICVLLLVSS